MEKKNRKVAKHKTFFTSLVNRMPGRSFNVNETRKNHRKSANVFIYRCVFFVCSFSKQSMSMSIIVLSESIDRSEVVFLLFDYDVKIQLKAATNKLLFSRFKFS